MALIGLLVTLEGTEGSGKSTLLTQLGELLRKKKVAFVATREPGGGPLSEKIRSLILQNKMQPITELFLYEAARAEHWSQKIAPTLKKGQIVLCDRFIDSTLAYQAHARKLPWKQVEQANSIAIQRKKPDLTFFLDIDPATGLQRAKNPNRFEKEGVLFQKKVRQGFIKARSIDPERWVTLKVEKYSSVELAQQALAEMQKRFSRFFK